MEYWLLHSNMFPLKYANVSIIFWDFLNRKVRKCWYGHNELVLQFLSSSFKCFYFVSFFFFSTKVLVKLLGQATHLLKYYKAVIKIFALWHQKWLTDKNIKHLLHLFCNCARDDNNNSKCKTSSTDKLWQGKLECQVRMQQNSYKLY